MGSYNEQGSTSANRAFSATAVGIEAGSVGYIDSSSSQTGAAEIHTITATGAVDIIKEVDSDGSGTFDVAIQVDDKDDTFHSQKNQIELTDPDNTRLAFNNTDTGPVDVHVTGVEVTA